MAKNKESASSRVAKSQEYVVDSSTSDDNSDSAPTPKAARKKSKVKSKSSSEVDSDTSASEDSSSDESTSSSASSRSAGTKRRSEHTESIAKPVSKKHKSNSTSQPRSTKDYYKPPTGYDPIDLDAPDFVSETSSMFSNLDGKQVRHITVPASIPVTSIKTLDIQAALRGEPIFTHKGVSYNMFAAAPTGEALLLPRGSNSAYAPAKVEVSRNFHLREVPNVKETSSASADSSQSKNTTTDQTSEGLDTTNYQFFAREQGSKKLPRKQPSGLMMRYTPYGSGSTKDSNKPYTLTHLDIDEAEQPKKAPRNQLVVPMMESDDENNGGASKRHKSPKKDKKSKKSASSGISHEDAMDVDADHETNNNNLANAPHSKAKPTSITTTSNDVQPESERKKKKKERKEKA